jgi:hypothetical protein
LVFPHALPTELYSVYAEFVTRQWNREYVTTYLKKGTIYTGIYIKE